MGSPQRCALFLIIMSVKDAANNKSRRTELADTYTDSHAHWLLILIFTESPS